LVNNQMILQCDLKGKVLTTWKSVDQLCRIVLYRYSKKTIQQCLCGELKRAYGFVWKYGGISDLSIENWSFRTRRKENAKFFKGHK